MECETCGAVDAPYLAIIEGAKMQVCGNCARMGRIITYPKAPPAAKPGSPSSSSAPTPASKMEFDLVEDFGMVMRNARVKMQLPLPVLAEMLNEKASFLERVEHGATRPSEALARKLEKELGIKLLEQVEAPVQGKFDTRGMKEVTLGDILELQRKAKRE